ncbi:alpha/beta hydrolase [Polyangium jinanense]|uniref:Alpha/beta hydrolase n=2 Tax=Polyangium jinanense TaxID=2829994 RepID=A0A9X4AW70_9BACT|nr:alpha/beta hydrolase [Polyangium jinanense]MDC3957452.1 alpha/beta hydrolase [Polyangium jinanense]MDC3985057.1 alpha/beta hydrolase [Polyangium jinanense]
MMAIVLGAIVVVYLVICWFVYTAQRRIVFPAPTVGRTPAGNVELLRIEGGTLMLFRPPPARGPVVVYFHGNGEQIADSAWLADLFTRAGAGFAAIEYPGYGLARGLGEPSEKALFDAAERGIGHLVEHRGILRNEVVLAGQSLGTGVAMEMAARGHGVRVLLLCPFTSLADVGARIFPFLPVRLLLQDRFDSAARASNVNVPVLVVHGTDDELIPVDHGQKLAARLPRGRFLSVAGAHHNDLWLFDEVEAEAVPFVLGKHDDAP